MTKNIENFDLITFDFEDCVRRLEITHEHMHLLKLFSTSSVLKIISVHTKSASDLVSTPHINPKPVRWRVLPAFWFGKIRFDVCSLPKIATPRLFIEELSLKCAAAAAAVAPTAIMMMIGRVVRISIKEQNLISHILIARFMSENMQTTFRAWAFFLGERTCTWRERDRDASFICSTTMMMDVMLRDSLERDISRGIAS